MEKHSLCFELKINWQFFKERRENVEAETVDPGDSLKCGSISHTWHAHSCTSEEELHNPPHSLISFWFIVSITWMVFDFYMRQT